MTLPSYAPGVSMSTAMIRSEAQRGGQWDINDAGYRRIAGVTSGQISFYDFYGKSFEETMYWDGNSVMNAIGNGGGSGWFAANPIDAGDYNWPFVAWIWQYDNTPPDTPDPGTGYSCFPAGTPVVMADGTIKMIEHVLIGDKVLGAYGEANTILAYDRTTLGLRPMYLINQEHRTTDTHTHITDRNTLASLLSDTHGLTGTEQSLDFCTFNPIQTDLLGTIEIIMHPGLPEEDVELLEELKIGTILKTINGNKTVETITSYTMPADTILYNFIVGGSHTYHVDGYVVTGFANGRDFDYRTWTYKTASWTLDDYRNFKG